MAIVNCCTNLVRGGGLNNTESVSRIVCEMEDMTTKYPFHEQVDKNWRSNVIFMGITYNSTGPSKKPPVENIPDQITKYYSCGMVQDTRNGPWKQYQQKRGTKTATNEEGEWWCET